MGWKLLGQSAWLGEQVSPQTTVRKGQPAPVRWKCLSLPRRAGEGPKPQPLGGTSACDCLQSCFRITVTARTGCRTSAHTLPFCELFCPYGKLTVETVLSIRSSITLENFYKVFMWSSKSRTERLAQTLSDDIRGWSSTEVNFENN